mmetsp:Transcript_37084/g.76016  ORF Transcript_37084/g.76016 Transcript_37084/m.76016 type:complete len:207 (-) Transcript_37084:153-773(-)
MPILFSKRQTMLIGQDLQISPPRSCFTLLEHSLIFWNSLDLSTMRLWKRESMQSGKRQIYWRPSNRGKNLLLEDSAMVWRICTFLMALKPWRRKPVEGPLVLAQRLLSRTISPPPRACLRVQPWLRRLTFPMHRSQQAQLPLFRSSRPTLPRPPRPDQRPLGPRCRTRGTLRSSMRINLRPPSPARRSPTKTRACRTQWSFATSPN